MGQVRLCRAVCLGPPQPHPRLQAQAGRKVTRHGNVNFQRPLTDFFYFYFFFFYQEGFKRKMGFQWLRKCREEKKQAIGKRAASMLLKKKKKRKETRKRKRGKDAAPWGFESAGVTPRSSAPFRPALSLWEPVCQLLRIIFILQFVLRSHPVLGSWEILNS